MPLLAQGFKPTYLPDYSVANQANQQFAAQQQGIFTGLEKQATDYVKEQKDLAQKDKEMAAKIKGTLSLLDNAKALYPSFAQQIDATKLQLSDPGMSNLDKTAIAGQVENSLNMMTGESEMRLKERIARYGGRSASSYEMKKTSIPTSEGNVELELPYDSRSGRFHDPNTMGPIKDLNKWYNQEPGWEVDQEPTSYVPAANSQEFQTASLDPSKYQATAFGNRVDAQGRPLDKTTANDYASGAMAKVKGDENISSSGAPYRGLSDKLPTIATADFPVGTKLNIVSNLFPQGRQFEVAGTGPKKGRLDFRADTIDEYNKLANQKITGISVIGQGQQQTPQGAIGEAASMSRPITQEEQANAIRVAAESADRATASTGITPTPATGDAIPVNQAETKPRPRSIGKLVLTKEQEQAASSNAEIQALRQTLDGYGVKLPDAMREGILNARESKDPYQLKAYADTLKGMADAAQKTTTALAPITEKERIDAEKLAKLKQEQKAQGEIDRQIVFRNIDEIKKITSEMPGEGGLIASGKGFVSGWLPQTSQARLDKLVTGVKSFAKMDKIQKMRAASPTGNTGLGPVSDYEGKGIEAEATPLSSTAKPSDILKDVSNLKKNILDMAHGTRQQRTEMMKLGIITKDQFNKAESEYDDPKVWSENDTGILSEEQQKAVNEFKKK